MANRRVNDGDEYVGEDDVTRTVESSGENGGERSGSGSRSGLADRLSEILMEEGDGDLLLQQSERESNFLQWLQALDFQVMGACRADERLKPLLKLNSSSGVAEDCLLAHLSQHFDASEVGLLARCLCVPLVSIRVGKVNKQGSLLCPTSLRGSLNLTLLPSSDLRISFVGDDGHIQRLATLSHVSESSYVSVEEIPTDNSGRSFQVQVPGEEAFYFWCSEKSKLLGSELLSKMTDLLDKKPTLPELTGICESRLECFASHLRSYLSGSSANTRPKAPASSSSLSDMRSDDAELGATAQTSSISVRPLRSRLSPRSSSFKECLPKTLSSLKTTSRDKLRRRGDLLLPTDNSYIAEAVLNLSENEKHSEAASSESSSTSSLSFLESLGKCNFPPLSATSQFPPIGSLLSPYYCWCPPCTSPIMSPIPQLPASLSEPLSLPPLSSLLPGAGATLDLSSGPSLDFPGLVSNPLVGLPFSKPTSQQIPTFPPLMCDPIVHIPILNVCSSGQGYLVSAGPAIATSIPPLHPKLVGTMMSETESMMDKGARETLRLLIGGSGNEPSATLMGVFPAVLEDNKQSVVVTGSRGLYTGTSDVDAIVNSFAAVGLASLSERPIKVGNLKVCGTAGATDALTQATGGGLDLQDDASITREEESD